MLQEAHKFSPFYKNNNNGIIFEMIKQEDSNDADLSSERKNVDS